MKDPVYGSPSNRGLPTRLILDTKDLVMQFLDNINGVPLDPRDIDEITCQIFDTMVNNADNLYDCFYALPNFNRMLSTGFLDQTDIQKINKATYIYAIGLLDMVKNLNVEDADGCFPYIFHQFIGGSLVLSLLPY